MRKRANAARNDNSVRVSINAKPSPRNTWANMVTDCTVDFELNRLSLSACVNQVSHWCTSCINGVGWYLFCFGAVLMRFGSRRTKSFGIFPRTTTTRWGHTFITWMDGRAAPQTVFDWPQVLGYIKIGWLETVVLKKTNKHEFMFYVACPVDSLSESCIHSLKRNRFNFVCQNPASVLRNGVSVF